MMKNFNINRFVKVCKRLIILRKSELNKWFLTVAGIIFIVQFFNLISHSQAEYIGEGVMLSGTLSFAKVVVFSCMIISGSFVISDIVRKQGKLHEIMLPATNLEKFASRLFYTIIAIPVALFAGFVVADLAQVVISVALLHGHFESMTVKALFDSVLFEDTSFKSMLGAFSLCLIVHATNVLGGMYFRKAAWLKTGLTIIGISVALFGLVALFDVALVYSFGYELYIPEWMQSSYVLSLKLIAISVLFYWLAYRIYCRLQIINNRWRNT